VEVAEVMRMAAAGSAEVRADLVDVAAGVTAMA
jgi:hypothetical protein